MQERTEKKVRALLGYGVLASLCLCTCCPYTTFLGRYPGSRVVALLFYRPAPLLLETTGLVLPKSADVQDFGYLEGLKGKTMTLRFRVSKQEALDFIGQKPFAGAAWSRHDYRNFVGQNDAGRPQYPYRTTSIEPTALEFLNVDLEEPQDGPWTFWIQWGSE